MFNSAADVSAGRSPFLQRPYFKVSWDLVSRVIIRVTILITPVRGLITLLTKSHDPPNPKP